MSPSLVREFESQVDGWMRIALGNAHLGFARLLDALPGVYPTEVLASVRRLVDAGEIDGSIQGRLLLESRQGTEGIRDHSRLLPPPHPLDFEWRFTDEASRALLETSAALGRPSGPCLLLGTPGVALEAIVRRDTRPLHFVGEDNAVTATLGRLAKGSSVSVATCEQTLPVAAFDSVIVDPPWYIDFIRPMLAAAASALKIHGYVLLSLPPAGTRPGIELDRRESLRIAASMGLTVVRQSLAAVGYQTPYFELNALRALGIEAPVTWRRGDLFILRKTEKLCIEMPQFVRPGPPWVEAVIGRMRIRVRGEDSGIGDRPRLLTLVDGDILSSVSRRDPRRSSANVWTSGNRVFACTDPSAVLLAAQRLATISTGGVGVHSGTINPSRTAISDLVDQLSALAALEEMEERAPYLPEPGDQAWWTLSSTSSSAGSTAQVSGAST